MTFGRDPWGAVPWAGTIVGPPPTGGQPPPIPGDAASFVFNRTLAARPWAYLSWAGGYPPSRYPGGGILAHADPTRGVVDVRAWWPYASTLKLVRIDQRGQRTPLRGAHPFTVSGTTRRNECTNPSAEVDLSGFVADAGTPTLTALVDAAAPAGTTVLRATTTAAGDCGVVVPTALANRIVPQALTVGFALRTSSAPDSVTVSMSWLDDAGASAGTTSASLTDDERLMSVGAFLRVTNTLPVTGTYPDTLRIVATGLPAGATLDLDAILVELGTSTGEFFDGSAISGAWLGTPGTSASMLAPITVITDAEAPLNQPLTYELTYPGVAGGWVTSTPPVTLATPTGGPGDSWLTHPSRRDRPLRISLVSVPTWDRTVPQGSFLPIGARHPIVVSAARRQAPVGELKLVTLSFDERDELLALLDDPAPVLVRFPPEFGYRRPLWLVVGKITEDRGERKGWHDTVLLSLEVTEVDTPPQ